MLNDLDDVFAHATDRPFPPFVYCGLSGYFNALWPSTWPDPIPMTNPTWVELNWTFIIPHPQYNATVLVPDSSGPERYAILSTQFFICDSMKIVSRSSC